MRYLATSVAIAVAAAGYAQPQNTIESQPEQNTLIIEALDSLTNLFYTRTPQSVSTQSVTDDVPVFTDSVYAYRLATIPSPIPMVFNPDVYQYIRLYTELKRPLVNRMLGLAEMFFPLFEETLDKYELPLEFKYLPIIESALNPNAVSRVGATGLWQFMYTTGKMYGLTINSYVDERRDPRKATDAACRFLKDLYALYGDWSLVLAAYNSGPGNVNKALRRAGGKTSYWDIREFLPRETRGYVPAFIGATYAFTYASEHNLTPELYDIYFEPTDTIHVRGSVDLSRVASHLGMAIEDLTFLNPALRRDKIPFTGEPYPLVLPMDKIMAFESLRDTIIAETEAALTEAKPVTSVPEVQASYTAPQPATQASQAGTANKPKPTYSYVYAPDTRGKTKLVYTVKSGDNLGFISSWYDVKVSDIQAWNNIHGSRIWVGQKLDIYVADGSVTKYRNMDNLSFQQKQAIEGSVSATTSSGGTTVKTPVTSGSSASTGGTKYISYTIQAGDNLWDISRKYPKNTVEDLKRINNITDLGVIKPGYVIKLAI